MSNPLGVNGYIRSNGDRMEVWNIARHGLSRKVFAQIEGVDYFETFSLIMKMATIRVVLALVSINRWHLQQLDVSNTFLHGDLSEDVYMVIPPPV